MQMRPRKYGNRIAMRAISHGTNSFMREYKKRQRYMDSNQKSVNAEGNYGCLVVLIVALIFFLVFVVAP